jgi:hypothetical protein
MFSNISGVMVMLPAVRSLLLASSVVIPSDQASAVHSAVSMDIFTVMDRGFVIVFSGLHG